MTKTTAALPERLRVVVGGSIVRFPLAGNAWAYLHYVVGLARCGHEVFYVEDSDDYRECCYDPAAGVVGPDPSYGLSFAAKLFASVGLADRWAYHDAHGAGWTGPGTASVVDFCSSADVLLNVSGYLPMRSWFEPIPARAFIDTDPAFEQVRQVLEPGRAELADFHTAHRTFAMNAGTGAMLPEDGRDWLPTSQPTVLDLWPPAPPPPVAAPFTTVMQWDSYPERELNGVRYGMKSASFPLIEGLPGRTGAQLEIALGSANAPRERLRDKGWGVIDPLSVTRDSRSYQAYVRRSRAEFAVAKHGYVCTRSGWFSERSANYLATGRPVVVQDTGIGSWLPLGEGVLAWNDEDEALEAIHIVCADYARQSRAARELAEEHFEARAVLGALLDSLRGEV